MGTCGSILKLKGLQVAQNKVPAALEELFLLSEFLDKGFVTILQSFLDPFVQATLFGPSGLRKHHVVVVLDDVEAVVDDPDLGEVLPEGFRVRCIHVHRDCNHLIHELPSDGMEEFEHLAVGVALGAEQGFTGLVIDDDSGILASLVQHEFIDADESAGVFGFRVSGKPSDAFLVKDLDRRTVGVQFP